MNASAVQEASHVGDTSLASEVNTPVRRPPQAVGQRMARAAIWMALDIGGGQILSFLTYMVVARILGPSQYGSFAIGMSLISIANCLLIQGFADSLIRLTDLKEEHISTTFWTNVAISASITLALQLASPLIAAAFHEPELAPVVWWLALLCLLQGLVSVQTVLCRREMDMAVFAIRSITAWVLGGITAIGMALAGFGVWSLVVCQLVQSVISLLVLWNATPWRPRLIFSVPAFRELAGFSRHVMAASLIGSLTERADTLVIGLFLDTTAVAYYALALRLLSAIAMATQIPIYQLVMPALSPMANDLANFRRKYHEIVILGHSIWMPIVTALGATVPILLPMAFGTKWEPAVPVTEVMCLVGLASGLSAFTGPALFALGRPDLHAKLNAARFVTTVLVLGVAAQFGILAVGIAWTSLMTLLVPLHLVVLHRVCGLEVKALVTDAVKVSLAGATMAIAMTGVGWLGLDKVTSLLLALLLGAATYLTTMETIFMRGYVTRMLELALRAAPLPFNLRKRSV